MFVGQVRKSPNVSETHRQSHARKNELPLGTPLAAIIVLWLGRFRLIYGIYRGKVGAVDFGFFGLKYIRMLQ